MSSSDSAPGQGTPPSSPQPHSALDIHRVVAFGGGHGLFSSLRALRRLKLDEDPQRWWDITAVVTVADNGGSSGRLREEFDMLPPGDLRQALVALAGEDANTALLARLFQHRFSGEGPLAGHAVGNLLLAGLVDFLSSPVDALTHAGKVLRSCGRVLPMSTMPLQIEADVRGVDALTPDRISVVRGQAEVAVTDGSVEQVRLVPEKPPACSEALAAVREADWLIFGPGSWFTSVLPHLLVPELRETIADSRARRIVTLNLAADAETVGRSAEEQLAVLAQHAPEFHADIVLADPQVVGDHASLLSAAESLGSRLVVAPLAMGDGSARHKPELLAQALQAVFDGS